MANIEFSDLQKDAIGEILNISMGSAATAVSELLSAKVWITTPRVEVKTAKEMEYHKLEPAVCIKIQYVKGLSGANMMVWKQDDVQLIHNQLMGRLRGYEPNDGRKCHRSFQLFGIYGRHFHTSAYNNGRGTEQS